MTVEFKMDRATKNTIRFAEVTESDLDAPKIGTIYVPKATLKVLGFKDGGTLVVEISTKED